MRQKRTITMSLVVGVIALMLLVSVACEPPFPTAEVQDLSTETPTPTTPAATSAPSEPEEKDKGEEIAMPTTPAQSTVAVGPGAEKAVAWAQADLAARLNVTTDQITIVAVEFVQWRDSSLGCPQPGMMYAQVITPGYRILLQSEEKLYEYHSAQGRDSAILCKSGDASDRERLPLPVPTQPPADSTQ